MCNIQQDHIKYLNILNIFNVMCFVILLFKSLNLFMEQNAIWLLDLAGYNQWILQVL